MKTLLMLTLALGSFTACAQTFHVTGVQDHIRGKDEESFSTAMHTRRYTGTIQNLQVVAEEAITAFSPASHIEIGHDYVVTKFKPVPGGALHVKQDPDKHGKEHDAWLTVLSVEEIKP